MRKLIKALVFTLALGPFLYLLFRTLTGRLTANPVEDIELTTGIWTFRLLILTLAVTPLRRVTGWNQVIQYRRMLGLFVFFYGTLHFLTYLTFDQVFSLAGMLKDVAKRPFILMGFTAFVAMIPLAITSTKGWIRRLGRRWQTLHRLIYVTGVAASIHYLWKVKVAIGSPVYYAIVMGILLGFRMIWSLRRARLAPVRATGV
jgi:methionine sulfoxide reductase heme-binding subunit